MRLAAGRPSQFVGTGRGFSSNFSIRRWFAARGRRTSSTRASRRPRLGRKEAPMPMRAHIASILIKCVYTTKYLCY